MAHNLKCAHCLQTFTATRESAVYCRDSCRVMACRARKYLCWYCGEKSTGRDHVISHASTARLRRAWKGVDTVECCASCNAILGAKVFPTMEERLAYLVKQFSTINKLHSRRPYWSQDELDELRGSLLEFVKRSEQQHGVKLLRLSHMRARKQQMQAIDTLKA